MPKNKPPAQLVFNFNQESENQRLFSKDDLIISQENQEAWDFLEKFFSQKKFDLNNINRAILKGENYSGKSHILHALTQNKKVDFLKYDELKNLDLSSYFLENEFYIIENFNKLFDEELLLHILNLTQESKSFLVLSADNIPNYSLKDLDSRIKNIFLCEIKNPENDFIRTLLINGFAKKQLKISGEIIDYLTLNLPRSYREIFTAIKLIENYCHENKKNLNLTEAKRIISQKGSDPFS